MDWKTWGILYLVFGLCVALILGFTRGPLGQRWMKVHWHDYFVMTAITLCWPLVLGEMFWDHLDDDK